jgi:hypothetical protein
MNRPFSYELEIGIFCVIAKPRKSPFIHFTIGLIDVMPILSRLSLIIMKKDSFLSPIILRRKTNFRG